MMSAPYIADAVERPLPLRMRSDLRVVPQWYRGRRHWLLKDPLALQYFHLLDEEHAVLEMLDGRTGLAEIVRRFEQRFAPRRLSIAGLQAFLGELHQRGLLLSDVPEQGERLLARRGQRRRRAWLEAWGNLLAIRLPGTDPDRWLGRIAGYCRGLFGPRALAVWLVWNTAAAILVTVHADALLARLPDFYGFFHAANLLPLAITVAGVKVLHELAHAVACKHWGGECHELGLMLLVFTPCLYCDVSDAWTLPDKWQRIAIAAAGVYVELFLAATCTFLWWFSEPGLFNSLCLNAVFICSLNTLLFNGNPLLRFDGYYLFADLLEIPNLQTRARAAGGRLLARCCLGVDLPDERALTEDRKALLVSYALASTVYRWVVVIGTFLFLTAVLKTFHLELAAQGFMMLAIAGMVAGPALRAIRFLSDPLMKRQIQRPRLSVTVAAILMLAGAVWLVPLPCRVAAPVLLEFGDAHTVYVSAPGEIREAIPAGTRVEPGAILARLADPETDKEITRLTSEREQQRLHLRQLGIRRGPRAETAAQIPAAEKLLAQLDAQLDQLRRRQQTLTLRAPACGTVLRPPRVSGHMPWPTQLSGWSGTPLDDRNCGSFLKSGTLFCLVGDPARLQGLALLDQADVEFVQPGQRVHLKFNQRPERTFHGTVQELAKLDLDAEPRLLAAVGSLPTRTDRYGAPHLLTTAYQARLELDEHPERLLSGAPGRCKIDVAPQSLGQRLIRFLRRTFRFTL
ncbi:MAG: hypothetical protein NTY19_28625 [Planctomycetota bacterium]|nr:hypothetical protein [Planctomycetota bacterium]